MIRSFVHLTASLALFIACGGVQAPVSAPVSPEQVREAICIAATVKRAGGIAAVRSLSPEAALRLAADVAACVAPALVASAPDTGVDGGR